MTRVPTLASWCMALATIFAGISAANAQDIKGSIRHTSSAIVIDGTPDDAAWATANEYAMTGEEFTAVGDMPGDADDLSATWKALWDDENLYFYAVVTDEFFSDDGPDAWQDDSFELYIDAEARGKGDDPAVVDYNADKEHPVYQLTLIPGEVEVTNGINHERWVTNNGESADLNAVANTSDTGYSIEWAIPWSTLTEEGSNPADILDRGFFGFGVAINDDDEPAGERQTQLSWGDALPEQWHLAADFPDVELLQPEGPGPDPFVKSSIDLGRVSAGEAVDFEIDVANVGTENTLMISSITVTGSDKDLVTVGELASVPPSSVGKLAVTLDPGGRTGAFDFNVEIQSNAVDPGEQTVSTRVNASVINFTGPAAHYAMDDDAGGTEIRDVTGYNRHGTLDGATLGGEGLVTGGSLNVSGGSQGVIPGEGIGEITDFTVSMWIQPSELSPLQTLIGQGVSTPTFAVLVQNGDLSWFSGEEPEFSVPGAIAAGTKYHVAASYTADQAVLYLDGVPVATQDSPVEVSIDPLDSYYIGAFEGGLAFSGLIDDVQIYDRVISAEDVAELFATPGTVLGAGDVPLGPQPEPGSVVLGTDEVSGFVAGGAEAAGPAGLSASYWLLEPKEIPTEGEPLHRAGDGGDSSGFADDTYATDPAGTFTATGFRYEGNDLTPVTEWLADDGASFEGTDGIIGDGLFRFEGFLYADKAGNQQIDFTSDDGSVLYVANQLVINNDNGHGNADVSGTVFFPEPGFYPIDVRYFNGDWTNDAGDHGGANFIASGLDNAVQSIAGPAGAITWGDVDLDTQVGDLIGGPSITFAPFAYDGGNAEGTFWTGDGGTTGDDILDSVYNSHGWNGDGASITLDGLTAGQSYQVQLLGAGDTRGCCNTRNQAGDDGMGNVSGDFPRGNSSVIGSFTASGDSQEIMIVSGTDNGVDPGLSGFIVTDASGGFLYAFNVGREAGNDITVMVQVEPSLIAHFPLDADGNSTVGGFVASTETDVTYGAAGANGSTGTSASFNGTSSLIQHDWSSELNPESFTLALWARSDGGAGAWNSPVTSRHDLFNDGEVSQGYLIYDNEPAGVWTFWSGNGPDAGNWQVLDGPAVNIGEWQHLAITYDDATETKRLYVNGELEVESNDSITPNDTTPFNIGSGQDFGTGFRFVGDIDDIGLWDGALDQAAIQAVMASGVRDPGVDVDPSPNLVGYWPADEGAGTTVADASGNGLDGTLVGGTWGAGASGGAFEVTGEDGGGSYVEVPATGKTFEQITITGWINGAHTGDWSGLIQARGGVAPDQPIGIGFSGGSGNLGYTWNDNSNTSWGFESGVAIPANEWVFIALSLTKDQATLYVGSGGELNSAVNAIPQLAQMNMNTSWFFGKDNCCGTARNFDGLMDDISIWDVSLSESDLLDLFNGAETPLTLLPTVTPPAKDLFLEGVGITENGVFGLTISDGGTADIEYSTDLENWEVIAPGVSGALEETDADRIAAPAGFYRAKQ